MNSTSDLTPILTELNKRHPDVVFRSGTVVAWNTATGANTVGIGGTQLTDLPVLIATEKLAITEGDVVGILRVRQQYFVLGRVNLDEGIIAVRDEDGSVTLRLGRTPAGGGVITTYHPDGSRHTVMGQLYNVDTDEVVGQGFLVQQDNGDDLIGAAPLVPGGPSVVHIRDPLGRVVFSTSEAGLLERPYMDVPLYNMGSTGSNGVEGSTFRTVWQGRYYHTHPAVSVQAYVGVSAAGTTGQVQFRINGNQIGNAPMFTNTWVGNSQLVDFGSPFNLAGLTPYSHYPVDIRVRAETGDGTAFCSPYGVTKRGSV